MDGMDNTDQIYCDAIWQVDIKYLRWEQSESSNLGVANPSTENNVNNNNVHE